MSHPLIAVPNVSEGRDERTLAAIGDAFTAGGARVLDLHIDPDHHRSVFTLAAEPGVLAPALVEGAREAVALIDIRRHPGRHPHVGAVDVAPVVFRTPGERGAAAAEALVLGDLLGRELDLPVFLYGLLAGGRTRRQLRLRGVAGLAERIRAGEQVADFGPRGGLHPTAGATLVGARPPLLAFNVELAAPATLETARAIAARIREGGDDGIPGVRALGLTLPARGGVAQVSTNVEDHHAVSLADVVAAVARHAPVAEAEVVGLPPERAFDGFPGDVPIRNRRSIESLLHPR